MFYIGFLGEGFESAEIDDFTDVSGSAAESGAFLLVGAAAVANDKVLKTIPCRFAYSVANEHVDEKKFHEKVLYRMRHNKYDSLRKSYNKVIKNKVNDVKQGLYQTIYLTLTIMAEDVADAKAHLVLWRVP